MKMNTNLFGQSTPVNQNRIGNSFLFGNTTAIPFSPSNLLGANSILQPSSLEATNLNKNESVTKLNKNDIQTPSHTKISNELRSEDHKENQKPLPSTLVKSITSSSLTSFLFDNKPPAMTFSSEITQSSTPIFTLGKSSSFFPTTNAHFNFSLSKPPTTTSVTTVPTLFSTTMNPPTTSSVDLQLFQTMLNTQPFNNELAFLARNIKPNVSVNRARLRTASGPSMMRPSTNLFSTVLTKPSVLSLKSNKRKLNDSFIEDDDNIPSSSINLKRPRMLDMNKIRSIVLGNNESSTTENIIEWKNFSTYDEYISSKKQEIKHNQRSFRLPSLTHEDYYTKPRIEELNSYFNDQGQCLVKQFTIGRKHYGSVTFQGLHMNLAGLDLDRLVEIDRRQVTVYPDEKDRPIEGEELNCQAIISLLGIYPIDRSIVHGGEEVTDPERLIEMNYGNYLEGMTKKFQGQFIDYSVYTGTWTFQVEHF